MRAVLLGFLTAAMMLTGCTSAVTLRHPQTGQTVTCGPYNLMVGYQAEVVAAQREARCLDDFQRQGYERVP